MDRNLIIVLGISVFVSFCSRMWMLTVSNALDISSAVMIVRLGGLCELKPVVIMLFMLCSAVVVECCFLKL